MRASEIFERWFLHSELAPALGRGRARRRLAELTEIRDRILEEARLQPGERVLDLGCGTGLLTFAAVDATGGAIGIDFDEEMLRRAALVPAVGATFARADARRLPFADAGFEVLVWRGLLAYTDRRPDALAEARRVLRPGGRISFSESLTREMSVPSRDPAVAELWKALHEIATSALGEQSIDASALEALTSGAGFTGVHVRTERRRTLLEDERAVREVFQGSVPGALSLAGLWHEVGVKPDLIETFLGAIVEQTPMQIETPEGYVTAMCDPD